MKPVPFAFPLLCICSLLLPQALSSQDFSSIGGDLLETFTLIAVPSAALLSGGLVWLLK
jgi:hypothetical protein